jgi:iron complex transport system substrate-binding protein
MSSSAALPPPPADASAGAVASPPPTRRCRVVSLLPSATELVAAVGAELVGRSHECDYPPDVVEGVPVLTGAVNTFENSQQMHDETCQLLESGQGLCEF